jgi:hypothetical protein
MRRTCPSELAARDQKGTESLMEIMVSLGVRPNRTKGLLVMSNPHRHAVAGGCAVLIGNGHAHQEGARIGKRRVAGALGQGLFDRVPHLHGSILAQAPHDRPDHPVGIVRDQIEYRGVANGNRGAGAERYDDGGRVGDDPEVE